MTATLTTPNRPATHGQMRGAVLPFLAGAVLSATVAFAIVSDDSAVTPRHEATVAEATPGIGVVSLSADAAERWSTAAQRDRNDLCTTSHRSPDAIEHCIGR